MFARWWIAATLVVFVAGYAFAQDPAKPTDRPTGLPSAIDWTFNIDWKLNENFSLTLAAAFADPQLAVEQAIGRRANFRYGMVFIAYSY